MANNVRPEELDPIDASLIEGLERDARTTNAELATRAGIAASTAHVRLRGLEERGLITGYHAGIDQSRLGRGLQAMIGVTLRPGARQERIVAFSESIRDLPGIIQSFFVGGADDFLVHVAVADSAALRAMVVEHISAQPSVASTRTSVIFAYHRTAVVSEFG